MQIKSFATSCLVLVLGCAAQPGGARSSGSETTGDTGADSTDTDFLTVAQVSDLPPGTAVGSEYSGTYVSVSQAITGCECAVDETSEGFCGNLVNNFRQGSNTVEQNDGALLFRGDDGQVAAGGVDADGGFRIGAVTAATDNETGQVVGDAPFLFEGRFTSTGWTADITFRMRAIMLSPRGARVDCQATAEATARREQ